MMRRLARCALAVALTTTTVAAHQPTPVRSAPVGTKTYAIRHARITTMAGPPIERGTLVIAGGRIVDVGADVAVPPSADVIDGTGLQVFPGFFDAASQLGLTEIGSVAGTNDLTELGDFNPQAIAAVAVHPASEHFPVARVVGITHALVVPGLGGTTVIGGQPSIVHLAGWTIDDMLVEQSVGVVVRWPAFQTRSFDQNTLSMQERPFSDVKKEYDAKVRDLERWIAEARHYAKAVAGGSARVTRDLKLEALVPVVEGKRPLLVIANEDRQIKRAIELCEQHKLRMVLLGGADAWKVKDLLAARKIPVILGPVQALPSREDEAYDVRNTTPALLRQAGIKVALGSFSSSNSRNLPYEIANAVPYGLTHEEALRAVTRSPAEILGVDDRVGSIELGKIANVIVTDGDPLEIRTTVKHLFINGEPTSLDNRHRRLYEQYRTRPRKPPTPSDTRGGK
jgi:imidazolonepropionase-like amidohydrolase